MSGRVRFETGTTTEMPALEPLLFELAQPGRAGRHVRGGDEAEAMIPAAFKRTAPLPLPELTEPQVVRHYTGCGDGVTIQCTELTTESDIDALVGAVERTTARRPVAAR